jgi:hypothetical protein
MMAIAVIGNSVVAGSVQGKSQCTKFAGLEDTIVCTWYQEPSSLCFLTVLFEGSLHPWLN